MTRFFVIFDVLVLAVLALQVRSLVRVARRPVALKRGFRLIPAVVPLTWELGISTLIVIALPAALGAGTWSTALRLVPDLALVLLAVSGLWLLTGLTRTVRLLIAARHGRGTASTWSKAPVAASQ